VTPRLLTVKYLTRFSQALPLPSPVPISEHPLLLPRCSWVPSAAPLTRRTILTSSGTSLVLSGIVSARLMLITYGICSQLAGGNAEGLTVALLQRGGQADTQCRISFKPCDPGTFSSLTCVDCSRDQNHLVSYLTRVSAVIQVATHASRAHTCLPMVLCVSTVHKVRAPSVSRVSHSPHLCAHCWL